MKKNDRGSVYEEMEKLKQRREDRKNKNDKGFKTEDYSKLIAKKKQGINMDPSNVSVDNIYF